MFDQWSFLITEQVLADNLLLGVFSFVWGACFGSFANVVIERLPKNESVVRPPSRCRSCLKNVKWYDNIPILSWLNLRGRCRFCSAKFLMRFLVVEVLMATLFLLAFLKVGWTWTLLELLILIWGLVTVSCIDLDHYIIPDKISLPMMVVGLVGGILNPERSFLGALSGLLLGGGFLWAIAYVYWIFRKEEGLGGGDIKLMAWIGAVLEWQAIPFTILFSSLLGSIVGLAMAFRNKSGLKTMIPFGPYIAAAAIFYLLYGQSLGLWYLRLFWPGIGEP